jgi:hypothetical protein
MKNIPQHEVLNIEKAQHIVVKNSIAAFPDSLRGEAE